MKTTIIGQGSVVFSVVAAAAISSSCSGLTLIGEASMDHDARMEDGEAMAVDATETGSDESAGEADAEGLDMTADEVTTANCTKLGNDVLITDDSRFAGAPALAFTGSEYGIAWLTSRAFLLQEAHLSRLTAEGAVAGSDAVIIDDLENSWDLSLVFSGIGYGVACEAQYLDGDPLHDIFFVRAAVNGTRIGDRINVSDRDGVSSHPCVVFTGSEYGIAWNDSRDGNFEIYFARVSLDGIKVGNESRITETEARSLHPSLVFSGSEFAVAWNEIQDGPGEPGIYFVRMAPDGTVTGDETKVSDGSEEFIAPSLVLAGSEYAVAWEDDRSGNREIFFARLTLQGEKIGEDNMMTNASRPCSGPSLVFTGSGYSIAWFEDYSAESPGGTIFFARVTEEGTRIDEKLEISDSSTACCPSLVFSGSEHGLAWRDDSSIFFTRIFCLP